MVLLWRMSEKGAVPMSPAGAERGLQTPLPTDVQESTEGEGEEGGRADRVVVGLAFLRQPKRPGRRA